MKKIAILITVLLSLNTFAITPTLKDNQQKNIEKNTIQSPELVTTNILLFKPAINSSSLFKIASTSPWQACRQECQYDFSICLQNGFDRPSCRIWYFQCLSENCTQ